MKYTPIRAGKNVLIKKIIREQKTAISPEILYFDRISTANVSLNPRPAYVIGIMLAERIRGTEIII